MFKLKRTLERYCGLRKSDGENEDETHDVERRWRQHHPSSWDARQGNASAQRRALPQPFGPVIDV